MNRPVEREIACPFCGSTDHELFSLFGQTLLGSQYYCRHCRTVFEVVRWEEPGEQEEWDADGPDAPLLKEGCEDGI